MAEKLSPAEPPVLIELRALVECAQAGDANALPRIRAILDDHPEIWQVVGDLSTLVERAWISALAADEPLARESMKRSVAQMKSDLAGEHPTRLEKMMVDQVIACWMEVQFLESASATSGQSLKQAAFKLKRRDSAHNRYMTAVKTLTTIRTLLPAGLAPSNPVQLFDPEIKKA